MKLHLIAVLALTTFCMDSVVAKDAPCIDYLSCARQLAGIHPERTPPLIYILVPESTCAGKNGPEQLYVGRNKNGGIQTCTISH